MPLPPRPQSTLVAALCGGLVAVTTACSGTKEPLFVARRDAGCPWPPASGLLAEWAADGNLRNEVVCSPFMAELRGTVPYGPGQSGSAWEFRSQRTTGPADPNYLEVPGAEGQVYAQVTVDAWVRQTHFNKYNGSDRVIVATQDGLGGRAGSWALYVHEDTSVNFYMRVSDAPAGTSGVAYASCSSTGPNSPTATPIDIWVRYTATYDGVALRCYRDGAFASLATLPAMPPTGAGALVIGRNYPGDIDRIRLFRRALDAEEIARPWP